ncbi:MAG: hypothetical protein WAM09_16680 [Anaerolineales bacterium]
MNHEFWEYLPELVDTRQIVYARPKGSKYHLFPNDRYLINYGFLSGTPR